ncbi:MAG: HAD-IA family hydrolase [Rickettsiaceae bacterium]|nr:HAD-IA family hydrolase [Rickettsiaceae bacterium]
MQNNKIKTVIFDVDGVIFKTRDDNGAYLWSRTIKNDLGLTSEHFSAIFSEKWDGIIRGKIDLNEHLQTIFQENLFKDLAVTPQQYTQYWLNHDYHVNQDILSLVESLEIPCYLGTNQECLRTSHILNTVGYCFKGCFASYKIGFIKPEQEFFQHIQETLLLPPHELLLIDDTKNNIDGAQRCGWHVYHYQNDIDGLINFLKIHETIL